MLKFKSIDGEFDKSSTLMENGSTYRVEISRIKIPDEMSIIDPNFEAFRCSTTLHIMVADAESYHSMFLQL